MSHGEARRPARVAERIRDELSQMLLRGEVRDPAARGVLVSLVRVTDDLRIARVYLRLLEVEVTAARRRGAVDAMERAGGFLRRELARRMSLKHVPELELYWDDTFDEVAAVDRLLDEVRDEVRPTGDGVAGAKRLVEAGQRFVVTCHRRPDADALGSALGLAEILRALGKEAVVFVPEPIPEYLRFLPGAAEVRRALPEGETWDACFITDTASTALLPEGMPERRVAGPIVVLDHHAAHDGLGDFVIRDTRAVATAEVVLAFGRELGVEEIPGAAATPLYAALVADTGGFRYPGTTGDTLRLGARLLDRGADPWEVAYELFEGWPVEKLRLLGEVIDGLALELEGRLAVVRVTDEILRRTGASEEMIEGMVSYGRRLRGVEIAAQLWQRGDRTRISLRSRGRADVSAMAVAMGGGGHVYAAGAEIDGDLEAAAKRVRDEARKVLG